MLIRPKLASKKEYVRTKKSISPCRRTHVRVVTINPTEPRSTPRRRKDSLMYVVTQLLDTSLDDLQSSAGDLRGASTTETCQIYAQADIILRPRGHLIANRETTRHHVQADGTSRVRHPHNSEILSAPDTVIHRHVKSKRRVVMLSHR